MASEFPAPPTYAEVIIFDELTKKPQFNPIWLRFFLDVVGVINGIGGSGVVTDHNTLTTLQGGTANQYYHLTANENTKLTTGVDADTLHKHAHNNTTGLQGGTAAEYYHLTSAQEAALTGGTSTDASGQHNHRDQIAIAGITLTGSPFTYQNTSNYESDVIVKGGTVSLIEITRDNSTFYDVGVIAGMFHVGPSDRIRVTYTVAPTMSYVQA